MAGPTAVYLFGKGVYDAFDGVTRAIIVAGQALVQTVLSLNMSNIVDSLVSGTPAAAN